MKDSISLQLSSADSIHLYPENRPFDFTVNLPPNLNLDGHWKVGVREISHSSNVIFLEENSTVSFHFLDEADNIWSEQTVNLPAISVDSPESIIDHIYAALTEIPRRPNTVVTSYKLEELVELGSFRRHRRKEGNAQSLLDIPSIVVAEYYFNQRAGFRVDLSDESGNRYFRKYVNLPAAFTRADLKQPEIVHPYIYNSAPLLPRKPSPTDWKRRRSPRFFNLNDVVELTLEKSTGQFKIVCKDNQEGVCAIRMEFNSKGNGLHSSIKVMKNAMALFPYPLKAYDVLVINSNLVQPSYFGDQSIELLTIVPRISRQPEDAERSFGHTAFKRIKYLPVSQSAPTTARIQFKTLWGDLIKFAPSSDATQITLHLIKDG